MFTDIFLGHPLSLLYHQVIGEGGRIFGGWGQALAQILYYPQTSSEEIN